MRQVVERHCSFWCCAHRYVKFLKRLRQNRFLLQCNRQKFRRQIPWVSNRVKHQTEFIHELHFLRTRTASGNVSERAFYRLRDCRARKILLEGRPTLRRYRMLKRQAAVAVPCERGTEALVLDQIQPAADLRVVV